MKTYDPTQLRQLIAGELISNGITVSTAESIADRIFERLENPEIPTTSKYGFLYFGDDGYWHWTAEQPTVDYASSAQVASSWEKFIFNYFGNSSEKLLQLLAVTL